MAKTTIAITKDLSDLEKLFSESEKTDNPNIRLTKEREALVRRGEGGFCLFKTEGEALFYDFFHGILL